MTCYRSTLCIFNVSGICTNEKAEHHMVIKTKTTATYALQKNINYMFN